MRLTLCVAEDRPAEEAGVQLALLSLRKFHPEAVLFLYRPNPTADFCEWLKAFPQVHLVTKWPGTSGWNCKPHAMLDVLNRGAEDVIWLDSDVLVARPFDHLFNDLDDQTMVVAEEPAPSSPQGTEARTKAWNLPLGRTFPVTVNSCLMRATSAHRPLLVRWSQLLEDPNYVEAQSLPWNERPLHFFGDQEPLNALLGSAEFADVNVKFLRRGRDVAHTGGARTYSLAERLSGLFHRIPPFFHSQWSKPWIVLNPSTYPLPGRFWIFHRIILEASPYVALARTYQSDLSNDTSWIRYSSPLGRLMRILGLGHFALRGLPLTIIATINSVFSEVTQRLRKPTPLDQPNKSVRSA